MKLNTIYNEECIDGMKRITDGSVDMILCDLPFGTTACKWDEIIPFEPLWEQYERVIKDNGAILLFGSEPFSSNLRMSNINEYKYDWKWEKEKAGNFQLAKKQPMKKQEDIMVFYKKFPDYKPQGLIEINKTIKNNPTKNGSMGHLQSAQKRKEYVQKYTNYPTEVLRFNNEKGLHESQKPVALFEYLIKTYTNEGEIVLDNCMGSGTTAIACLNTNRNFIGFELDKEYYDKSIDRINEKEKQLELLDVQSVRNEN
ncbi:DNA methylase [Brochothrix phage BtpYZU03]|nr:DNA methylase [Brochothrix phage BtpYZU03]